MEEKELDEILGLNNTKQSTRNALKCQQCGSSDLDNLSNNLFKCKHCGASFDLEKNVVNNFITNINKSNSESTSNCHIVDSVISEQEFLKEAYTIIAMDEQSPTDVLTASFNPVTYSYSQFMVVDVHYTGVYSATIGFDRKEKYEDFEKVYDRVTETWIQKKVIKERTVTDWQPYNGNISVDKLTCVKLGGEENNKACDCFITDIETLNATGKIKNFDSENNLDIQVLTPTQNDTNLAIRKGEKEINADIHLPGDHYKDYNLNVSHTINSINYYIVPEYILNYQYQEDKCKITSFAYDLRILGTVPDVTKEVKKDITKKTMPYAISTLTTSIIVLLFSLISLFVINEISLIWLNIVLIITSIAVFIIYYNKSKKIEHKIKDEIYHSKLENLKTFLIKNNLPLSEDDEKRIEIMTIGWR